MFFFLSGGNKPEGSVTTSFNQTVLYPLTQFLCSYYLFYFKDIDSEYFDSALSTIHLRGQLCELPAYFPPLSLSKNSFNFQRSSQTLQEEQLPVSLRSELLSFGVKM